MLQDGYQDMALELAEEKGHDPDNGLRGGKYSLYDAGTHIPLIVYWKGHMKQAVSDAWFCQMDLFATFGEIIGGKVPEGIDAESHPDVLLGKELAGGREAQILEAQGKMALRKGNYVYIPVYSGKNYNETGIELGCNDHETLWNLKEDPSQQKDVSGEEPGLLQSLREEFLKLTGSLYDKGHEADPLQ